MGCLDLAGYAGGGASQAEEELGSLNKAALRRGMQNLADHFPFSHLYPGWDIRFTALHATADDKAYLQKQVNRYGNRLDAALVRPLRRP